MKRALLVAVCALCANVFAEAQPIGDSTTTWEMNGTALVIGGTGDMPGWIYAETSKRPWDSVRGSIEALIIGERVTHIGMNAFLNCNSLTSLAISTSVTSIGLQAFAGCTQLRRVTIPSSVTIIEADAFLGCNFLEGVMMNSAIPPELEPNALGGLPFGAVYVPVRSKDAYKSGKGWGGYESKIVEPYFVTIAPTKYGTVSVERAAYYENDNVEVTVTPDEGHMLKSLSYNDGEDHPMSITARQFWMPGRDVTVSAVISWEANGPWRVGEGVSARLSDRTLIVEGCGAMNDFASVEDVPWYEKVAEIEKVTIDERVTKVGSKAWEGMSDAVTINGAALSTIRLASTGFAEPIVPEGMVLVTKDAIRAAKATTISVIDGEVQLGISVKYNEDITTEPSTWKSVEPFAISIPVKSKQGFMLLQSGEGRIGE